MSLKLLHYLFATLEAFNPCFRFSSKGRFLDNINNFRLVSGKHVPDQTFLINYFYIPFLAVFGTWRIFYDDIRLGHTMTVFYWRGVVVDYVLPLISLFI